MKEYVSDLAKFASENKKLVAQITAISAAQGAACFYFGKLHERGIQALKDQNPPQS